MSNRQRPIRVIGNWKMNHGPASTHDFFSALGALVNFNKVEFAPLHKALQAGRLQIGIAPSFVLLGEAIRAARSHVPTLEVAILAQNAHAAKAGAYTGEIAAFQLKELGVQEAIIGHSERRQLFGESDEVLAQKLHSLLEQDLHVLYCIGETLNERQEGKTREILKRQLRTALAPNPETLIKLRDRLEASDATPLTIAYEPVWAIGTGVVATPEQAAEAHAWVRSELSEILGTSLSQRIALLYGGSVTPENFAGLLAASPEIDGGLVGGASLKVESLANLLKIAAEAPTSPSAH